jgi:hypothetical protein
VTPTDILFKVKRTVLDKGCADAVELQPKHETSKIEATIFNLTIMSETSFNIDRALYGRYEFVEITPKNLKMTVITDIRLYLVEKIWSLTLLEMIR